MNTIKRTQKFLDWIEDLTDLRARIAVLRRIDRAQQGNFGDHKSVGDGVWEMRIDKGKGYRVYYAQEGQTIYLLISGGDKSTQPQDIQQAKAIWRELQNE